MNEPQPTIDDKTESVSVWDFDSYKEFLVACFRLSPRGGRGQFKRLASVLGVHPTMITHVFRDDAQISPEQAVRIARHLGLAAAEREGFLLLVLHNRSSDHEARAYFRAQFEQKKTESRSSGPAACSFETELAHWRGSAAALHRDPNGEFYRHLKNFGRGRGQPHSLRIQLNWRQMVLEELPRLPPEALTRCTPLRLSADSRLELRRKLSRLWQEALWMDSEAQETAELALLVCDLVPIPNS